MTLTDAGAKIKDVTGINPTNAGSETINGAAIDRDGFLSAVLRVACGAASGVPTAQTVDGKLQESADGSAGWTDVAAVVTQLSADNTGASVDVSLKPLKRYIRAVVTVFLDAGTTPALPVAATVILGGAIETPI